MASCVSRLPLLREIPILLLLLGAASIRSIPSAAAVTAGEIKKVSLALYYESLCPYSADFIVDHLAGVFNDGLLSIAELQLVPYGNARLKSDDTISCQHGPYECVLNTVEACAISAWPDLNTHFNFIYCVESLVVEKKYLEWETCFTKLGLDPLPVMNCMNSGQGYKLELEYAEKTSSLRPPHEYVPWVVVNGQPLYEDYENFEVYVCKAYGGSDLPKACEGLLLDRRSDHSASSSGVRGCYRDVEEDQKIEMGDSLHVRSTEGMGV